MTIDVSSPEQIAAAIRERRRSMKVSQKRLAKMCGMSQSTIARIETDMARLNPSYAAVFYVASALNKLDSVKYATSIPGTDSRRLQGWRKD